MILLGKKWNSNNGKSWSCKWMKRWLEFTLWPKNTSTISVFIILSQKTRAIGWVKVREFERIGGYFWVDTCVKNFFACNWLLSWITDLAIFISLISLLRLNLTILRIKRKLKRKVIKSYCLIPSWYVEISLSFDFINFMPSDFFNPNWTHFSISSDFFNASIQSYSDATLVCFCLRAFLFRSIIEATESFLANSFNIDIVITYDS